MALGKDVAMLASLVAPVGDVPLEREVLHLTAYFAPQALPQAEGFSSFFGSAAPQALPQAEGFSSFLGSAAPQALPQALELLMANEATKPPDSVLFIEIDF